jgi:hemerythrin superfamily protein
MDILDLIRKDHRQVETLFKEIENTNNNQELYDRFNELYKEINLHAKVEEQTFYPAIRESGDHNQLVSGAQKEHDKAKELLEEIASLSPASTEFEQKIRQLKEAIQHHVQEEEKEVFPLVSECMSAEEREQLGREFTTSKSQLQNEISALI